MEDSLGLVDEVVKLDVVPEETGEEVVVDLVLVSVLSLEVRLQDLLNSVGGLDQVVVGDLVEEVVCNVPVSDVMHRLVQSESVEAIDCLGLSTNEAPLISFINLETNN